jgi:hypothetical protein
MTINSGLTPPATVGVLAAVPAPPPTSVEHAVGEYRPDLTRRLRVLLHAGPLLKLRRSESNRPEELQHYDTLHVALRIFDLVLEHTGFARGVDSGDCARHLAPVLAAMDRAAGLEPHPARHADIVEHVLAALRNDENRREKFRAEYVDLAPDGTAARVYFEFALLQDVYQEGDGRVILRLTNEATNLYHSALDLDIESAQAAAEAVVHSQLERGKFAEAAAKAEEAQLHSRRLAIRIDHDLDTTRRDVRMADWSEAIPAMLESAATHLDARFRTERAILGSAEVQLRSLDPDSAEARHVGHILHLIQGCLTRHSELSTRVARARSVFLAEQGRQGFAAAVGRRRPDLGADVLAPMLALPLLRARGAADAGVRALGLLDPPTLLDLSALVAWQLRPRREVLPHASEVVARDLTAREPEPNRFPPAIRAAAVRLLEAYVTGPTRLSDVLAVAEADGAEGAVVECAAFLAVQAYGGEHDEHLPIDAERLDERFEAAGMAGDDLLLSPKVAAAHAASATNTADPTRTAEEAVA